MATVHMSEAEVARDLHAVLAKVRQGFEIVIEQNHEPVAVSSHRKPAAQAVS
jgi:PHD/YefM family antitoxin component YafN of YafNO toxin-antitoxin module